MKPPFIPKRDDAKMNIVLSGGYSAEDDSIEDKINRLMEGAKCLPNPSILPLPPPRK
jgi:hypothetical protein